MRIVISATADFPEGRGGTPRIRNIARGLRELDSEVTVYVNHAAGYVGKGQNNASIGEIYGIAFEFLNGSTERPAREGRILIDKILGGWKLLWRIIRTSPDAVIIYNHTIIETGLMIVYARLKGIAVIFDVCDERFDTHAVGHQQSFLRRLNSLHYAVSDSLLYKAASGFFVVSDHLYDKIRRLSAGQPVLEVPLVADIPHHEDNAVSSVRRNTIMYMGSIIPDEGLEILIDAVHQVRKTRPQLVCVIVGGFNNSAYESVLKDRISAAGLDKHVEFMGPKPFHELHVLLQQADLLALPRPDSVISRAGFPGKLSEYLNSGRPIVSTSFGDIKKYFDAETMYICDNPTAESFGSELLKALNDDIRRDAVGAKAKIKGHALFHYTSVCKTIIEYIRSRK